MPRESKRSPDIPISSSAVANNRSASGISATAVPPLQLMPDNRVNNTGLPDGLKTGVEALSGFSMDDVKVHYNSDRPAQLQAYAYAQGPDIHIAPGQERHLPHEAWHVVQQKQGRVGATMQLKGSAINDDSALEAEANHMGSMALAKGGNAGRYLPQATAVLQQRSLSSGNGAIQRNKVTTNHGEFIANPYEIREPMDMTQGMWLVGARIRLAFKPFSHADAASNHIGLVQTVRVYRTGMSQREQYDDDRVKLRRMTEDGTHIDQASYISGKGDVLTENEARKSPDDAILQTNPVYHAQNKKNNIATKLLQGTEKNGFGQRYDPSSNEPAILEDSPYRVLDAGESMIHTFEVAAVTLTGSKQKYLGSVSWGYEAANEDGTKEKVLRKLNPEPLEKVSDGDPSDKFLDAASRWNNQDLGRLHEPVALPIPEKPVPPLSVPQITTTAAVTNEHVPEQQQHMEMETEQQPSTSSGSFTQPGPEQLIAQYYQYMTAPSSNVFEHGRTLHYFFTLLAPYRQVVPLLYAGLEEAYDDAMYDIDDYQQMHYD